VCRGTFSVLVKIFLFFSPLVMRTLDVPTFHDPSVDPWFIVFE